jgi:hypothetical protein
MLPGRQQSANDAAPWEGPLPGRPSGACSRLAQAITALHTLWEVSAEMVSGRDIRTGTTPPEAV